MPVVYWFFRFAMLTGLWLISNTLLCLRAATLAFVNFVLVLFRAADVVAFFLMDFRVPLRSVWGDFLLADRFEVCERGIRLIGEMLIEKLALENDGSGLSIGVEGPCCCWQRLRPVRADEGPGASWMETLSDGLCLSPCMSGLCVFSDWAAFFACASLLNRNLLSYVYFYYTLLEFNKQQSISGGI